VKNKAIALVQSRRVLVDEVCIGVINDKFVCFEEQVTFHPFQPGSFYPHFNAQQFHYLVQSSETFGAAYDCAFK